MYFSFSATRCLTLTVVEVSLSRVLVTMLPNQTHPQGCVISLNTSVCSSSFSWGRITDHTSHLSITVSLSHTGIKWNECRGYITEANYTQLNAVKMYFYWISSCLYTSSLSYRWIHIKLHTLLITNCLINHKTNARR